MNKEAELIDAVKKGDLNKVQELLKNGADVNAKNAIGETVLMKSIIGGGGMQVL